MGFPHHGLGPFAHKLEEFDPVLSYEFLHLLPVLLNLTLSQHFFFFFFLENVCLRKKLRIREQEDITQLQVVVSNSSGAGTNLPTPPPWPLPLPLPMAFAVSLNSTRHFHTPVFLTNCQFLICLAMMSSSDK